MASMVALFGSVFFLWSLLAWFAGAVFCSTVATAKNLNPSMWFLGGLLFPVIALIAVAGMPTQLSTHEKKLLLEKYDAHEAAKKETATQELVVRDENGNIVTPKVKNGPPSSVIVGTLVLLVLVLWFQAK